MIVKCKILYVHSPSCIDIEVSLPFGMSIRNQVWLHQVDDVSDKEIRKKATHCLVVLVGGKTIYAELPDIPPRGRVFTTVYRNFESATPRFPESVVTDHVINGSSVQFVSVNKYMGLLSESEYNIEEVRKIVIGADSTKTPA